eukprot:XP_014019523.1 PREDICTED: piggyBac transposable element-derived protein 4-like [Salmo salar]
MQRICMMMFGSHPSQQAPSRSRSSPPTAMSITPSDGSKSTTRQRPHSSSTTPTAGLGTTPLSACSSGGAEAGRRSRPQRRGRGRGSGSSTTEDRCYTVLQDDEEPEQFRFKPKRPEGPQLVSDETYTPLQLFQLYFTTSVLGTLIGNTDKKQQGGRKMSWKPVTMADMLNYMSLVIYMGLVQLSRLFDNWSKSPLYRFEFPTSIVGENRFLAINCALHMSDPQKENDQKKGAAGYDCLARVKPLYHDMVEACKTYYQPAQNLYIVERMVASKTRIGLKQYMKNKPTKWGYKLFVLANSESAYTWNFFIYEGKVITPTGKGLSYDSVMQLMDFLLLGSEYKLFEDNFCTSHRPFHRPLEKEKNGGLWHYSS